MSNHPPVVSWYRRIGRLQLRLVVWRHRYPSSSDRWVFQPALVYDRKERGVDSDPS